TNPCAVDLERILLAADLRLQAGPVIVALQGQRVEKLDARVEAEPPKVDHRHWRRSSGLEMYQVEELVVEQAGSAIERGDLLRGRALDRLEGGRATIALPVASCNHQVIAGAGSHRSERELLDCRGLIHDSLPAEAARSERVGSVLVRV